MKAIKNIPPNSDGIYSSYSSKKLISPFIKEGVFLNHKPPINYNYSIENFEYVTGYNNELITIGKGGYGKLYLAKNKIDNKEYAIKCVSKKKMKEMGVDSTIMKREIDIHIRITHPHIIKLYSYLEDRQNAGCLAGRHHTCRLRPPHPHARILADGQTVHDDATYG